MAAVPVAVSIYLTLLFCAPISNALFSIFFEEQLECFPLTCFWQEVRFRQQPFRQNKQSSSSAVWPCPAGLARFHISLYIYLDLEAFAGAAAAAAGKLAGVCYARSLSRLLGRCRRRRRHKTGEEWSKWHSWRENGGIVARKRRWLYRAVRGI